MTKSRRALSGIRVLEMTVAVAGPVACHILGDMGAEVIKVEEPNARVHTPRTLPSPRPNSPDHPFNRVPNWVELNRSKRHIALNVATPEGREIFLDIAAKSDVVIENFSPRVMGNLGIDYEDLKKVNPSIIMVSMPAFGKTGPYKARGSYGPGIDAMSGISHLTGYVDRGPGKPANFFCDQNAGLHAAFFTMSALRHRRRTGEGQYIEMSMLEGEVQIAAPAIMEAMINGNDRMRMGNRHEYHAPHGVYPCAGEDEWAAIAVTSDAAWQAFAVIIGQPQLAEDPRFARRAERYENQELADEIISAWTRTHAASDVQSILQRAGVAAGNVVRVNELFADPQVMHRGSFAWVDHEEIGAFPHTRTAWRSHRGNHGVSRPAPLFGEANDYVLRELLGRSEEDVVTLMETGIMASTPIGWTPPDA